MWLINLHSACVKFRGLGRRFCRIPHGSAHSLFAASLEVCVHDVNGLLIDKQRGPLFGPVYTSSSTPLAIHTKWIHFGAGFYVCGIMQNGSRDTAVWTTEESLFDSLQGQEIDISFLQTVQTGCGAHQSAHSVDS